MKLAHWAAAGFVVASAAAACRGETETDDGDSTPSSSSSSGNGGGTGGTIVVTGSYILAGVVVTPAQSFEGQVLIDGATIACAAAGSACAEMDPGATVIDTGGIIAPGLIDTHNHILFDIFDEDDWAPSQLYQDHTEWPDEAEYALMLDYKQCLEDAGQGKPLWCPQSFDGDGDMKCEMDKWGELKGLVAGTTSIVGLPGQSSECFGALSRSIDVEQNDLGEDHVQTSSLFPPSGRSADGVCANFTDGDTAAYLIHVGEGVNQDALDEFTELGTLTGSDGCLYAPQTTITHGTAFGSAEFAKMADAGMKLTWSPASNVALYGTTTDIPAALDAGVLVALAPDWSMGGSQNLLDELRFARAWSDDNWGGALDDQMLVEMVTVNAATVLGLADRLGKLEAGYLADLVVIAGDTSDPYGAIVDATPATLRLVLIDGVALYGDPPYEGLAPELPGCDAIDVCGAEKFLCVADSSGEEKAYQAFDVVRDGLESALAELDAIEPLAPSDCANACAGDEECFTRTVHPEVDESMCGGTCAANEGCFQTSQSASYECLTLADCAAAKTGDMAPLTPLVKCP